MTRRSCSATRTGTSCSSSRSAGVCGEVAHGPTFKYRRRGFSRVNAVEYGPESFHEEIERRHPALYAPEARARIKAAWAPALSIVLLDEGGSMVRRRGRRRSATRRCDGLRDHRRSGQLDAPRYPRVGRDPAHPGRHWLDPAPCPLRAGRWVARRSPAAAAAFERSHVRGAAAARLLGELRCRGRRVRRRARAAAAARSPQLSGLGGGSPPAPSPGSGSPEPEAWEVAEPRPHRVRGRGPRACPLQLLGPVQWRSLPLPDAARRWTPPTGRRPRGGDGDRPARTAPAPDRAEALVRRAARMEAAGAAGPGARRGSPLARACRPGSRPRRSCCAASRDRPPALDRHEPARRAGRLRARVRPRAGSDATSSRARAVLSSATASTSSPTRRRAARRMLGRSATSSRPPSR